MSIEDIQKFLDTKANGENAYVKIDFRKRNSVYGLFITGKDTNDLRSKNFWRIVPQTNFEAWKTSKSADLAKIFNGMDFSKLTPYNETF